MKKLIVSLVLLIAPSVFAAGGTVVVADIDDTIKESHVLSTIGSIGNAFKTNAFWGMPELLRSLGPKPNLKVFYVSNAPEKLMGNSHRRFLAVNKFPPGELVLRNENPVETHKKIAIDRILRQEQPKFVVFLGDDGERDAEIYDGFTHSNDGIAYTTFIHAAYSHRTGGHPMMPGQISFAVAGEVAVHLMTRGLLNPLETAGLVKLSLRRPGKEWDDLERRFPGASLGLPDWFDCRDHQVTMPLPSFLVDPVDTVLLGQKIKQRCAYVIDEIDLARREKENRP